MASRATAEKWLGQLTYLPTAPGIEDAVVRWVERWVSRRDDLRLQKDSGGNLLISQKGKKVEPPVLAVAHMDHPAFVITGVEGRTAAFEFRGGVTAPYFTDAPVEVVSRLEGAKGVVVGYDADTQTGEIRFEASSFGPGDIATWRFPKPPTGNHVFHAPACDDLAGAAAALAALDRCRNDAAARHFGILLTRAEEVGLVGAIHAARTQSIPANARLLSIETSRELPDARIGDGPVIRTGDRSTVFDRELTNRISRAAASSGIKHQRKLMSGGSCEATAFGAYGYQAAGLCLALGNWHNRGNLDRVEAGTGEAIAKLEEISLDDFHGLIDLLVLASKAVDLDDPIRQMLDKEYERGRHILG